jgi:predicted glycosyltransferase
MKILLDIGHPAEFHFFRNFIKVMTEKGHDLFITVRNKDCNIELLNEFGFNYVIRGKGTTNIIGKIFYIYKVDRQLYKIAKQFQPDIFISFSSPYCAQVSTFCRKPHIAFEDTEHSFLLRLLYWPFSKIILTSNSFKISNLKRHIRFYGYKELGYLHKNFFTPNPNIFKLLGLNENEKYVIVRFISWNALHDIGHKGLSHYDKIYLVKNLLKYANVFISSEEEIPDEIKRYKINIPASRMHDALAFASLYVGEGASMAAESAVLGTPAIYNYMQFGYLKELEEKYGLIFNYKKVNDIIAKSQELLTSQETKANWQLKRNKMLEEKIDVTAFMVWFVENYPESIKVMKENPNFQKQFL